MKTITVDNGIIGPQSPRPRSLQPKIVGDYPAVPKVYLEVADNYATMLYGNPPVCDELVALIRHLFTEEEAMLVRHIKPLQLKTASAIANAEHRDAAEVTEILERLANDKMVLFSIGSKRQKHYSIMPFAGGTFEFVLMGKQVGTAEDKYHEWRRRFAELYDALYQTGYFTDYAKHCPQIVRTLPVEQSIACSNMALPSDRLEDVFDRYDTFGVGNCSCRLAKQHLGEGCGRPVGVCIGMGPIMEITIQKGISRRAEKKEVIEIKKAAADAGLINWVVNLDERFGRFGNYCCSCCGCCCLVLRTISEFNVPGMIAPPHFVPEFNLEKCSYCGLCAKRCQLGAITVDAPNKIRVHNINRCIGCGQCVLACSQKQAVQMTAAKNYKKPAKSWPTMALKMSPHSIRLFWNVWKERRKKKREKYV